MGEERGCDCMSAVLVVAADVAVVAVVVDQDKAL